MNCLLRDDVHQAEKIKNLFSFKKKKKKFSLSAPPPPEPARTFFTPIFSLLYLTKQFICLTKKIKNKRIFSPMTNRNLAEATSADSSKDFIWCN